MEGTVCLTEAKAAETRPRLTRRSNAPAHKRRAMAPNGPPQFDLQSR